MLTAAESGHKINQNLIIHNSAVKPRRMNGVFQSIQQCVVQISFHARECNVRYTTGDFFPFTTTFSPLAFQCVVTYMYEKTITLKHLLSDVNKLSFMHILS